MGENKEEPQNPEENRDIGFEDDLNAALRAEPIPRGLDPELDKRREKFNAVNKGEKPERGGK